MSLLAAILLSWGQPTTADYIEGMATYYNPGIMQVVADYRGVDLSRFKGGIAMNRKGDLGRVVWIEWEDGIDGPYIVTDCANRQHYQDREQANYIVEVDAEVAKEKGFFGVGPVPVHVYFQFPFKGRIPL